MNQALVRPIRTMSLKLTRYAWPFAIQRRAEIDAHFENQKRETPHLWNGQVLMLGQHTIEGDRLSGDCFQTDFSSFLAWRDWKYPDPGVYNLFAQAALRGSDGPFLLGVMSEYTVNRGRTYFPSGTPDPQDVSNGAVDLDANLWRELVEETGLTAEDLEAQPEWLGVFAGHRIALTRILQSPETGHDLRAKILRNVERQQSPELADIMLVSSLDDLGTKTPDFVTAALVHIWNAG